MKKIYFLLFLLLQYETSLGSHAMGAEITYSCLGNNQYIFNYTLYRDCNGIVAPSSINLAIGSQSAILNPTPNSPEQLPTVCPTLLTTCNGGSYLGIEKWVYTGVATLPSGPVTAYFSISARNASITTILNASTFNLFVSAYINSSSDCNNSPVFDSSPITVICQGSTYCIPSFASDPDGDSLSFEFVTPRSGPSFSDTLDYLPGYSSNQPLTSIPPITINSLDGTICISPVIAPEVSPMAILVSEFRNGVLIGQIVKDIQVSVVACNNYLPSITGFNGTPSTLLSVCSDQQNCFFIASVDLDMTDTLIVNWDGSIPNTSTTNSFGKRDTLYVCWTPSDSDTLQQHCFYATVSDNHCPFPGSSIKRFCMNVIPSSVCNPVNVDEIAVNTFNVYPQPASDEINFRFEAIRPRQVLVIYQLTGREEGFFPITGDRLTINTTSIPGGIYIAAVMDENGAVKYRKRIVLVK